MNAALVYKQPAYTEVDFADTSLESITGALPHMFLTISGVARVSSHKLESSKLESFQPYPQWMYHVGEFEQWLDGSNRVLPLTTFRSSIDFIDIFHAIVLRYISA
jgi:hypothetical protein